MFPKLGSVILINSTTKCKTAVQITMALPVVVTKNCHRMAAIAWDCLPRGVVGCSQVPATTPGKYKMER
eukprot:5509009-Amphidinium_carterae.1